MLRLRTFEYLLELVDEVREHIVNGEYSTAFKTYIVLHTALKGLNFRPLPDLDEMKTLFNNHELEQTLIHLGNIVQDLYRLEDASMMNYLSEVKIEVRGFITTRKEH